MPTLFDDLGDLGEAYAAVDWAATALGPVEQWDPRLVDAVQTMLRTRFPVTLFWGPELTLIYNEAYVTLIADKHPGALGRPTREVFPEVWELIGPMLASVVEEGRSTWVEDALVPLRRRGFLEECYFTFSYSPLRDEAGALAGAMDIATETTQQVLSRRRLRLLTRLNVALAEVTDPVEVPTAALGVLREADDDLVEVDLLLDGSGVSREELVVADDAGHRVFLPLTAGETAALVVRPSPMLKLDDSYLGFLRLLASTLRQALDRVRLRTTERAAATVQRTMSEAFQRSLLPAPMTAHRLQVAARYQPAVELAQVGGDWYDFFEGPDGSLSLVIGDVAGHDQQAAAAMATVRNVLRGISFSRPDAPPSQVLQILDDTMSGTDEGLMATGVLARVSGQEPASLTWTNAGHPPPVLVDAEGRARLLDTEPDLLLGLDGGTVRVDHTVRLEPGETLLLYTDGLVERRDQAITHGLEWLLAAVDGTHLDAVDDLADSLVRQVAGAQDDVALLVVRG